MNQEKPLFNLFLIIFFSLVTIRLRTSLLDRANQELETNFRIYWRSLITIASNLHRTVRTFFLELTEKLIEPWKQNQWTSEQVKQFLAALTQTILDLDVLKDQDIRCLWDRYMQVINICLIRMYHS